MNKKCELLAPAGGLRSLRAAAENGADAVYIGGKLFNARINADNFTDADMKTAVNYAHLRNVKVYVTMNTLVKEEELPAALDYAGFLYLAGADALILQDLGLARLIRKMIPEFSLHLSTQGTIYNRSGVRAAKELGFSRVVLARELTLTEIEEIAADGAAEIEVFVHGALCICYSGQCQMSRMLGGRSGNRGLCAQPCRLAYSSQEKNTRPLSPKDLCTVDALGELVAAGVSSLKIEGRMKSAEYVAIVTRIYRKYLDEYLLEGRYAVSSEDRGQLAQIFNRGGFTSGYFSGNPGPQLMSGDVPKHQGIRIGTVAGIPKEAHLIDIKVDKPLKLGDGIEIHNAEMTGNLVTYRKPLSEDGKLLRIGDLKGAVKAGQAVYKITDSQLLKEAALTFEDGGGAQKYSKRLTTDMHFSAELDTPCTLQLCEPETGICITVRDSEIRAERAVKKPVTPELIEKQLRKSGDTPFDVRNIRISMAENLSMPLSSLNRLRRSAFSALTEKKLENGRSRAEIKRRIPSEKCETAGQKPALEFYFYRGEDALTGSTAKTIEQLRKQDVATDRIRFCIPLRDYMENGALMSKIWQMNPQVELLPYIFPISKGPLDQYIEGNFQEIAEACVSTGILIGNLGWCREFLRAGVQVYGDFGLNLYNPSAFKAAEAFGICPAASSLEDYPGGQGAVPLMVTEHLIQSRKLIDRKGVSYPLLYDRQLEKTIIFSADTAIDGKLIKQRQREGDGYIRIYCRPE